MLRVDTGAEVLGGVAEGISGVGGFGVDGVVIGPAKGPDGLGVAG